MSTVTTINPATEKDIQTYDIMTEKEATERLEAFHEERAPYLRKIWQKLRDNADELAALMTSETGKVLKNGRVEVELCAALFDCAAENGPEALADEERVQGLNGKRGVPDTAKNVDEMCEMAIDPDAIAREIAYAIEQPEDVDVNEIIIRPTKQPL